MSTKRIAMIACDAMQYFEIDLPEGADPDSFAESEEARAHFADLVSAGLIDFEIVRRFDGEGREV